MKKILSVLFAILMMLSAISCLSVGALSDSTADETMNVDVKTDIDPDLDMQVRKDVYENIYKGIIDVELDDIVITYFGALSDGSLILNYSYIGAGSPDVTYTETLGDYYYVFYSGDIACVYKDHNFYDVFKAYSEGLIDDNSLAELCEISKEYSKHPYNDCYFNFHPKTGESGLDYLVESEIKFDAYKNLFGYDYVLGEPLDLSDIMVTYFGTLSDGSLVLNVEDTNLGVLDWEITETIGNYRYVMCDSGQSAYIYKNHQFYYIVDAYSSGIIDGDVLDELYEISEEYSKHPINFKYFVLTPLSEGTEFELGAVLVDLKKDAPPIETLLKDFEIVETIVLTQSSLGERIYYVKFAEETEEIVWKAIAVLEESPYVTGAEPNYFLYVEPPVEESTTEIPTQAVSTVQPTTEIIATTSGNPKSSTSDTPETNNSATSDTVKNVNSNGVVQTGQNNSVMILTLLLIISAAGTAVFIKFRYRD